MPVDTESHCGCPLSPGVWGNHGWHQRLADAPYLLERERIAFYLERSTWTISEKADAWAKWLQTEEREGRLKNGRHANFETYIGLPIHLEPCPAYMAVVSRNLASETKRKKGGGRRRMLGDEELPLSLPYKDGE